MKKLITLFLFLFLFLCPTVNATTSMSPSLTALWYFPNGGGTLRTIYPSVQNYNKNGLVFKQMNPNNISNAMNGSPIGITRAVFAYNLNNFDLSRYYDISFLIYAPLVKYFDSNIFVSIEDNICETHPVDLSTKMLIDPGDAGISEIIGANGNMYWVSCPNMKLGASGGANFNLVVSWYADYITPSEIGNQGTIGINDVWYIEESSTNYVKDILNYLHSLNIDTDKVEDAINNVNDTLNNSEVDDNSSAINNLNDKFSENNVISSLITMPVTLYQKILLGINGTCSTFNLGTIKGNTITMPCINISNYIGSSLWNIIDILFSGIFVFTIGKRFIKIFDRFTNLEDGDVLDD